MEFNNRLENTPLLFAAKRNQYYFFKTLASHGANMYVNCNKLLNVLHYAVLNENEKMIELIVFSDAESNKLINEKNYRDETPIKMDERHKFQGYFDHIWAAAMSP